jgi:7-alpha-hydroxysteroid dehydrogenase
MILDSFRLDDRVAVVTGAGRGFAAYRTVKAALAHYTRLAALDLCPRIRVNTIAPSSILTPALDIVASNDALREPMERATPMCRLGTPADIAAAAVYLASPAGSYLTGKTLEVDGGITFPNLDLPIPDL